MNDIEFTEEFSRFKQALLGDDFIAASHAHIRLYSVGAPLAPIVIAELDRLDLSKGNQSSTVRLANGLAGLLFDVDPSSASSYLKVALAGSCSPAVTTRFAAILDSEAVKYAKGRERNIPIWQHPAFGQKDLPAKLLKRWISNMPSDALTGVRRITVLPQSLQTGPAGIAAPFLGTIQYYWVDIPKWAFWLAPVYRRRNERLFYAEIGRHKHRTVFGNLAEQNRAAEIYAANCMRKSHPLAHKISEYTRALGKRLRHTLEEKLDSLKTGSSKS